MWTIMSTDIVGEDWRAAGLKVDGDRHLYLVMVFSIH